MVDPGGDEHRVAAAQRVGRAHGALAFLSKGELPFEHAKPLCERVTVGGGPPPGAARTSMTSSVSLLPVRSSMMVT